MGSGRTEILVPGQMHPGYACKKAIKQNFWSIGMYEEHAPHDLPVKCTIR